MYDAYTESEQRSKLLISLGIMGIVRAVMPIIGFSPEFRISFDNFKLSGANAERIISILGPLVVAITATAMAKTTPDPVRCSVVLGLSLILILMMDSGRGGGGGSMLAMLGSFTVPSTVYGQQIVYF